MWRTVASVRILPPSSVAIAVTADSASERSTTSKRMAAVSAARRRGIGRSRGQPSEPRPAAPGRRSLTDSPSGSIPPVGSCSSNGQPEPVERLARRGGVGGRQHERAVGVLGHADDARDVHATVAERRRDAGERARSIVELDREPDRHEAPPCRPDGTRSSRYASDRGHTAAPATRVPRDRLCPDEPTVHGLASLDLSTDRRPRDPGPGARDGHDPDHGPWSANR